MNNSINFVMNIPHLSPFLMFVRNPLVPASDPGVSEAFPDSPVTNSGNSTESNHDSVSFPADTSPEKSTPDSKALVSIPATSLEALAMVPLHRKSKRSEVVQRRIRRPFSVSEVEALVQAVERLGTGRYLTSNLEFNYCILSYLFVPLHSRAI